MGCSCGVGIFTAHDVQVDEMWVAAMVLVGTANDSMAILEGSAVTDRAATDAIFMLFP